jgi:putative lipoic acid-binding regulatory protein
MAMPRRPELRRRMTARRFDSRQSAEIAQMDYAPSVELLEATHNFPGPFLFKVIGQDCDHFIGRVVGAVRAQLPEDIEPAISTRRTANGKHVCVSIEPTVASAQDVIAMYGVLRDVEGVMMLF